MSYDFTGKLIQIYDTEQIKDTFKKREFVVEQVDGQYPNPVKFELTQDRCSLIDGHNVGDEITVSFDIRGRAWNDKYFTNLQAWRLQAGGSSSSQDGADQGYASQQQQQQQQQSQGGGSRQAGQQQGAAATETTFSSGETEDDLPF